VLHRRWPRCRTRRLAGVTRLQGAAWARILAMKIGEETKISSSATLRISFIGSKGRMLLAEHEELDKRVRRCCPAERGRTCFRLGWPYRRDRPDTAQMAWFDWLGVGGCCDQTRTSSNVIVYALGRSQTNFVIPGRWRSIEPRCAQLRIGEFRDFGSGANEPAGRTPSAKLLIANDGEVTALPQPSACR